VEKFDLSLKTDKKPTDLQIKKLQEYFNEMPLEEVLAGLHFAKNRWAAKDAGVLKVGRESIIQREVHSVTSEQAQWRLKNWKMMIANYRKRGYSYPTISRIKKILLEISKKSK
jgi:2-oxoglutarate dehydrogenase complex dehydrogenase (E1) component-like enzyme